MEKSELKALLEQVLTRIRQARTIETEVYALLVTLFPTVLAPALDIIDHGRITKLVCQKSRRTFHKVKEIASKRSSTASTTTTDEESTFDVLGDYCFCYFYAKECLSDLGSACLCKHVLAVMLAEALSGGAADSQSPTIVVTKEIEDRDYAPLLLQSRAYMGKYEDAKVKA